MLSLGDSGGRGGGAVIGDSGGRGGGAVIGDSGGGRGGGARGGDPAAFGPLIPHPSHHRLSSCKTKRHTYTGKTDQQLDQAYFMHWQNRRTAGPGVLYALAKTNDICARCTFYTSKMEQHLNQTYLIHWQIRTISKPDKPYTLAKSKRHLNQT